MSSDSGKGTTTQRVIVVVNSAGEIIGTTGITDERDLVTQPLQNQMNTGLKALPGQSVHILEMPNGYFECESAIDRHRWLSRYKVAHDPEPRLIPKYSISDDDCE